MITKLEAILSLLPDAKVTVRGDQVEWLEPPSKPVTDQEIDAEVSRLQADYAAQEYKRKRAAEYPDFKDYLDGVVKGDQAQIQAYIDACLAVKQKYPKPQ